MEILKSYWPRQNETYSGKIQRRNEVIRRNFRQAGQYIWANRKPIATGVLAATQAYHGDYIGAGLTVGYYHKYAKRPYTKQLGGKRKTSG